MLILKKSQLNGYHCWGRNIFEIKYVFLVKYNVSFRNSKNLDVPYGKIPISIYSYLMH